MLKEHFANQIERLKRRYSVNAYPDELIKELFKSLTHYPDSYMERATGELIKTCRQYPLEQEFLAKFESYEVEKAEQARAAYAAMPVQITTGSQCRFCNGSGYATVRKNNYDFSTLCDCSVGSQRPKTYLSPKKGENPGEEITMLSRQEFLSKGD